MRYIFSSALFTTILATSMFFSATAKATGDRQSFLGGGVGFEVLARDGSGTGFYLQLRVAIVFLPI